MHNFYIVGPGPHNSVVKVDMESIANQLYPSLPELPNAIMPEHGPDYQQKMAFYDINQPLVDQDGKVETGEVLYIPSIGLDARQYPEIQQAMLNINAMVAEATGVGKLILANHHHLLGAALSFTHAGFDLRKAYLKANSSMLEESLEQVKSVGNWAKSKGIKGPGFYQKALKTAGTDQLEAIEQQLDMGSENYLRSIHQVPALEQAAFADETGASYASQVLNLKRVGFDANNMAAFERLFALKTRLAKAAEITGRLAIVAAVLEGGVEVGHECVVSHYGAACVDSAVRESLGVGFGTFGSEALDLAGEPYFYAGCNALLDFETGGVGILFCTVAVSASASLGGYYVGNKVGNYLGGTVNEAGLKLYHKYFTRIINR